MDAITSDDVRAILFASRSVTRRTKDLEAVTARYGRIQKRKAVIILNTWNREGVPENVFYELTHEFVKRHRLQKQNVNTATEEISSPLANSSEAMMINDDAQFSTITSDEILNNSHSNEQVPLLDSEIDSDNEDDALHQNWYCKKQQSNSTYSLKQLLQHFAAVTNQRKSHLSCLLRLLKDHQPEPDYDSLPSTGQQLMCIDSRDEVNHASYRNRIPTPAHDPPARDNRAVKRQRRQPLKPAKVLNSSGKYIHFGLESALAGVSAGLVFKNSDVLQYINIHRENPQILPKCLRNMVESFSNKAGLNQAEKIFMSSDRASVLPTSTAIENNLPHFNVDIHVDGASIFNNSEKSSVNAILGRIHSMRSSFYSTEKDTILYSAKPFFIGIEHSKNKTTAKELMMEVIEELKYLDPHDDRESERQFTATLRVVIADTPMRSFLKRIIGHSGYWACERCIQRGTMVSYAGDKKGKINSLDTIAPLRRDDDFLEYMVSDECIDNHVNGLHDLSPFLDINFKMISGFIIDPMHTVWAGALSRRLVGFVHETTEGKLSRILLQQADARLKIFEKCYTYETEGKVRPLSSCVNKYKTHEIRRFGYYLLFPVFKGILGDEDLEHAMLLPYGMMLLGGFNPCPVKEQNVEKARAVFKNYILKLIELKIHVRFTAHELIHIPDDVLKYQCGVECNSAFPFENFLRFLKIWLASGHLPLEQYRNRLLEKQKYLLPMDSFGNIFSTYEALELESISSKARVSNENLFIKCTITKTLKKLIFSTFTLSNVFPNNVCLFKTGSIVVIQDIVEFPVGSNCYNIIGRKFRKKEPAFLRPYNSTDFSCFVVSGMKNTTEWDFNVIAGKMVAMPHKFKPYIGRNLRQLPDITSNQQQEWIVYPIMHTIW